MSRLSALLLDSADNVAVALKDLSPGERLDVGAYSIEIRDVIQAGHKVAVSDIPAGEAVIKYGEVIGIATATIQVGAHAHVHNVESARSLFEVRR